jgi:hypothetical protein
MTGRAIQVGTVGFVVRSWKLLLAVGTMVAIWQAFNRHTFNPKGDQIDSWILVGIGVAYLLAMVWMIFWNDEWTTRGCGQFLTYLGDASLYGASGLWRIGWRHPLTAQEMNLVRACFVVGGAMLALGLVVWLKWHRSNRVTHYIFLGICGLLLLFAAFLVWYG